MDTPYDRQALLNYLIEINKNQHPNPMKEEDINRLAFSKYRDFNGETMPLPYSIKIMLSYDKDFMATNKIKILDTLFDALDEKTDIIHSYNLNHYFQNSFPELEKFKWNNFENAPAIIRLNHGGDQLIFIYLTEQDEIQEYPICRFDQSEFSFCMTGANFNHHMFDIAKYNTDNYNEYLQNLENKHEKLLEKEYYV